MKHLLLTTIAAVVLVGTAFADPIHNYALNGYLAGVKKELDRGVDVNTKGIGGDTPLHTVIKSLRFRKEIVELLIAEGANVNAKDDVYGRTPLRWAAGIPRTEVVELLIAAGADVNVKDWWGRTPLDEAIGRGNPEAADLLRKHGAKTSTELALMPHLEYGKDQWPFGFSFTAMDGVTYVVEVTQDFKQWGELETIKGRGKQVEFIDPRQPLVQFKRNFYRVKPLE